jgi:ribosomal protein S4
MEALRILKRRLSDVVYRAMLASLEELETDTRRHDTLDTQSRQLIRFTLPT